MKKSFRHIRNILLVSIIILGSYLLEKIDSVREVLQGIKGILNAYWVNFFMLIAIIVITVGGIVYVKISDKKKDQ